MLVEVKIKQNEKENIPGAETDHVSSPSPCCCFTTSAFVGYPGPALAGVGFRGLALAFVAVAGLR